MNFLNFGIINLIQHFHTRYLFCLFVNLALVDEFGTSLKPFPRYGMFFTQREKLSVELVRHGVINLVITGLFLLFLLLFGQQILFLVLQTKVSYLTLYLLYKTPNFLMIYFNDFKIHCFVQQGLLIFYQFLRGIRQQLFFSRFFILHYFQSVFVLLRVEIQSHFSHYSQS